MPPRSSTARGCRAFALLLLLAPPAAAQQAAQQVRSGQAAFGDWHGDAPGVVRLLRPDDLPQPHATASHSNGPSLVDRPAGAVPRVPDGFTVALWASGLREPRVIRTAPGGDVFVAESGAGRIRVFRPASDGSAGAGSNPGQVFASGLDRPFGIAFWPPGPQPRFLYVADTDRVVRFPFTPGALHAQGPAETVVPRLPTGGHWTRDLAVSPDGNALFVSVGSASNVAEGMGRDPGGDANRALGAAWGNEAGRADVLRFDPDGAHGAVFATGLRNCVGLAVQPATGALWCATNERDGLGDNLPPDYATALRAGGFYGWPWFYIGDHPDTRPPPPPAGLLGSAVAVPDVLIQPHSAPLGITFYDGAQFPPEYRGDAFVALHGSWNRGTRTGYKVVRLRMRANRPTGEVEDFLTGFVADDDSVWGRPVDVAVAPDGSLLVTEDGNGTIWRISRR